MYKCLHHKQGLDGARLQHSSESYQEICGSWVTDTCTRYKMVSKSTDYCCEGYAGPNCDALVAPQIRVNNMTFYQEDTLRVVTCIATGSSSNYTYYPWKHMSLNGKFIREIAGNDRGILTLPVTRTKDSYQDNGKYVCKAGNGIIQQSGYGFVTIHAKPAFMPDIEGANISNVIGAVGRPVEIKVQVFSVPSYESVNWYHGINRDIKIIPSPKYSLTESSGIVKGVFHNTAVDLDGYILTLKINSLIIDDFNTYTIQLQNNFGSPAQYKINLIKQLKDIRSSRDINIPLIIVGSIICGIIVMIVGAIIVFVLRKSGTARENRNQTYDDIILGPLQGNQDSNHTYEYLHRNQSTVVTNGN
ncbi:unnamed protein product [Mytilus edulis]|uniref:Ig-like domain-containing protein n=1 Tax=Mytilus edulis TaxID=6550 RepID=A0A8S3QMK8_MYTED|nr:unnamed protein product [Mytilus edulis]